MIRSDLILGCLNQKRNAFNTMSIVSVRRHFERQLNYQDFSFSPAFLLAIYVGTGVCFLL